MSDSFVDLDPSETAPAAGAGTSSDDADADSGLGWRAARTRSAILDASKKLFLERGYAGTRISNITDACGISRAGFYTYYRDKREIFSTLGDVAYHELLAVVGEWDRIPQRCSRDDVEEWVRRYFAFMDEHGAFILSVQSGPADEEVRAASNRMQMRVVWLLGVHLRNRQRTPTDAPEALGTVVQAMMDRCWYQAHAQHLPVAESDLVQTIARFVIAMLAA
jgi:AcrR family transcriptional regulator